MKTLEGIMRILRYITITLGFSLGLCWAKEPIHATHLIDLTWSLKDLLGTVLKLTGAAMVLGSFYQYYQHRRNPINYRLSTLITLFILGICLYGMAFIPMQMNETKPRPIIMRKVMPSHRRANTTQPKHYRYKTRHQTRTKA